MSGDEAPGLRSSLRDLVALTTLPGLWLGRPAEAILSGLVDVAVSMARLDVAYARVWPAPGAVPLEAMRGGGPPAAAPRAEDLGRLLEPWLAGRDPVDVAVPGPAGDRLLHFTFVTFGVEGRAGALAAGSARAGFPTEGERLLLSVAANQACIALEAARQAAERSHGETRLRGLAAAAVAINAARSVDEALQIVTDRAREIIGAHRAATSVTKDQQWTQAVTAVSLSDAFAPDRGAAAHPDGAGLEALVCGDNRTMRLTQADLQSRPAWRAFGRAAGTPPPMRGWLAAPLVARDGHNLGLIQLSDKDEGEFTEQDEVILGQLAHLASVAIENARLYRETQEANRLKDEFLATLSHELRTPLNAILGWARVLRDGALDGANTVRAVETIERNALAQARLIEDVLDVSRIITGKLKVEVRHVELGPIVEAALDAVVAAADAKGITLQIRIAPAIGPLLADASRLQQVVWNLLANAIKFTPPGGRVDVVACRRDSEVELRVQDTGRGIDPAFLPHVFERFRQADSTTTRLHAGLGLGLAIVRHLVELHGGTVHAGSAGPGRGAVFTVRLPLAAPAPPAPEPAAASATATGSGELAGTRLLVVDDDRDARELLAFLLERAGATVTCVASVEEALSRLASGPPDVLISDVGMPGLDGYGLIARVRARQAGRGRIPAVAVTAYASSEHRMRALAAGFDAHLAKPVDPAELARVVAAALGRSAGGQQ